MVLATVGSGVYKLFLFLHILTAILGFGAVLWNAAYAVQARKRPGPGGLARPPRAIRDQKAPQPPPPSQGRGTAPTGSDQGDSGRVTATPSTCTSTPRPNVPRTHTR